MPGEDLGTMQFDHVDTCGNVDIINMVAIIDTGLRQFSRCPSATTTNTHPADVGIMEAFADHVERRFEHFFDEPELYMPQAHPKPKRLPPPPTVKIVENASIQTCMYSLSELRTQLLFSEDAERSNGFRKQTQDVVIRPWIVKFKGYIAMLREEVGNDAATWAPDSNIQEPGVNASLPR